MPLSSKLSTVSRRSQTRLANTGYLYFPAALFTFLVRHYSLFSLSFCPCRTPSATLTLPTESDHERRVGILRSDKPRKIIEQVIPEPFRVQRGVVTSDRQGWSRFDLFKTIDIDFKSAAKWPKSNSQRKVAASAHKSYDTIGE